MLIHFSSQDLLQVCLLVAAEFDAHWGKQSRPDPRVKPRSHAARIRLESRYYAEVGTCWNHFGEFYVNDMHFFTSKKSCSRSFCLALMALAYTLSFVQIDTGPK